MACKSNGNTITTASLNQTTFTAARHTPCRQVLLLIVVVVVVCSNTVITSPPPPPPPRPPRSILKQTPGTPRRQREVAFETVEIHYHAMELVDHPSSRIHHWRCRHDIVGMSGHEAEFNVDMYELYRTQNRRKSIRFMILNYLQTTRNTLENAG